MKKTILITGATGYIGSHIVVQLLEKHTHRYNLILVGTGKNSHILARIEQITHVKPNFIPINLLNFCDLKQVFMKYKIDAVIHLAGLKGLGVNPLEYYHNNIIGTLHLLKCCEEFHVEKIIYSSSASVYGHTTIDLSIKEEIILHPISPYGRTKSITETILEDVVSASSDWRIIILRCFNPIGAHASGFLGETGLNHIVPNILQVICGIKSHVIIFGNDYKTPDGTAIRDYIHVIDLAEGFIAALDRLFFEKMRSNCEIYNLGTGVGCSVLELLSLFERVAKITIPYKFIKRRTDDVAITVASTEKVTRELLWRPNLTLLQACEDALRFFLQIKPI